MSDPDAFYSAVAQSSAAFVAIVGGLATGFVLNRAADRASLAARIAERRDELGRLRGDQQAATSQARRARIRFKLDTERDSVLHGLDLSDKATAMVRLRIEPTWELSFTEEWDLLRHDVDAARDAVRTYIEPKRVGEEYIGYEDWDTWILDHRENLTERGEDIATEVVYDEITGSNRVFYDRQESEGYSFFRNPVEGPPMNTAAMEVSQREQRQRDVERLEESSDEATYRTAFAQKELDFLEEQLRAFRLPPHLKGGLLRLSVFTVTGILFPLILMPQDG